MESISRIVMSPCLQNIHGHPPLWTRLLIGTTNHNDTRSRREDLGGYLGGFTALSTPALYDSRRVLIAASLRNISCSDSDICLRILRRVAVVRSGKGRGQGTGIAVRPISRATDRLSRQAATSSPSTTASHSHFSFSTQFPR